MSKRGFIFDMDGVIVDTAKYHYQCWKNIAEELDIPFTIADNEQLKGVSRVHSLEIILKMGGLMVPNDEKERLLISKNNQYLDMVSTMDHNEILPGVAEFVMKAKLSGLKIALGSASKNARRILAAAGITGWFDVVVDGNDVTKAKPDPEVFLIAAIQMACPPDTCVVFEDSYAGVQAANAAGMVSVGIGATADLPHATHCYLGFDQMPKHFLHTLLNT